MSETLENIGTDGVVKRWDRLVSLASRFFVWGLLFGVVYLLRSFFLLIFLTFVFSYIQAHGVRRISPQYLRNRSLAVVFVGISFLGVVIAIGSFLTPRVVGQAALFAEKYPSYLRTIDRELSQLSANYPMVFGFLPTSSENVVPSEQNWSLSTSTAATILQQLLGFQESTEADKNLNHTVNLLRNIGQNIVGMTSAFLLSLLFSFLIVLDLPKLTKSVTGLADTKVGFIYQEVAENIRNFGLILGHALEAQLIIALLNTVLTAVLIVVLGLGSKLAFFSIIVFLCSFVPVAG
ncbi:MAG TPA: AI-2E family transporter, partial [Oligoflexia bacterium]|nr:AI-2E family transporter [Oligoflexia bacterium]